MQNDKKDRNGSQSYPLRINNAMRYKAEIVAKYNGRSLAEHIKWLLSQSVTNYEINKGQIDLEREFDEVT